MKESQGRHQNKEMLFTDFLSFISYTTQDHLLRGGTTHLNQENAPSTCLPIETCHSTRLPHLRYFSDDSSVSSCHWLASGLFGNNPCFEGQRPHSDMKVQTLEQITPALSVLMCREPLSCVGLSSYLLAWRQQFCSWEQSERASPDKVRSAAPCLKWLSPVFWALVTAKMAWGPLPLYQYCISAPCLLP